MHRLRFGLSWLKLITSHRAGLEGQPIGFDEARGLRYVTFEINDIELVWERLLAQRVPVYRALGPFGTNGLMMGMVLDPDGNVVELVHCPASARIS